MTQGAIYIITQDARYEALLVNSARSLKRVMPELRISAFSQFPIDCSVFEQVIHVESSGDGFYDKTLLMQQTPYDRTLFVDADTYFLDAVTELYSLLDSFDFAATHEEYLNTDWWNRYPRPDIPGSFPEFNTGILAYRRSASMDRLLGEWSGLYGKFRDENPNQKINDQPFFRVAAYKSDVRIATLPREYNCKFRGQGYLNGSVKILHGHVNLRLQEDFVSKAAEVLNASLKPRVFIAGDVYEQSLVGRILDRRKPRFVGRFSLLPEPTLIAGTKSLFKMVRDRGAKKMASDLVRRCYTTALSKAQ